jgi:hypothetical protein
MNHNQNYYNFSLRYADLMNNMLQSMDTINDNLYQFTLASSRRHTRPIPNPPTRTSRTSRSLSRETTNLESRIPSQINSTSVTSPAPAPVATPAPIRPPITTTSPLPTTTSPVQLNSTSLSNPQYERENTTRNRTRITNTPITRPVPLTRDSISSLITNTLLGSNMFWDSVPVAPTTRQIAIATSDITLAELQESSDDNEEEHRCPITMERFNENSDIIRINACGHCFTKGALLRWFRNHVNCPVCRRDIRTDSESTETTESVAPVMPQSVRFDFILDDNRQG